MTAQTPVPARGRHTDHHRPAGIPVTILCSDRGVAPPSAGPEAVAQDFALHLTRRAADRVVTAGACYTRPVTDGCDVLIISARVSGGAVDPLVIRSLTAGGPLAGTVVFLVAVGPWPAEADTLTHALEPLVRRSGGLCIAPPLHVHTAAAPAIEAYCRHWSPLLPGAVAARQLRTVAA